MKTKQEQAPKETPAERRQRVLRMLKAGMKGRVIAEWLGVCPQRVSQLIKVAKERGEIA